MPTLDDVDPSIQFTMLKGEPGTRKSTQALSYPGDQYWFSTDRKMNALLLPMKKWGYKSSKVTFDNYRDYTSVKARLAKFQETCSFQTIVFDSITSLGDNINRQTLSMKSGTTNKDGENSGHMVGGIAVNTMQDYKAEASAFAEWMDMLKDIHHAHRVNIVMIAHVVGERPSKEGERKNTHMARIIVTGGKIISAKIPAYCDEVYHFNIKQSLDADSEGKYGMITRHTGDDFARTCLPLDREILFNDDPLYDRHIAPAIKKLKEMQTTMSLK